MATISPSPIPIITVDGPSGVGKSTLCRALSGKLGWQLLDSGAIYRMLALAALHQYQYVDLKSEKILVNLATALNINFAPTGKELEFILEGKDVSNDIRTERVGKIASILSIFPRVREVIVNKQKIAVRRVGSKSKIKGLIADGRDMGTVVFPNAQVKIFLNASVEIRAHRRLKQLQHNGYYDLRKMDLLSEIKNRDDRDSNRIIAPLVPAKDALIIDSTRLSIDRVIDQALVYIKQILVL